MKQITALSGWISSRVTADRVIAALVAVPAQLLEEADQRQPFACRSRFDRQQQRVKLLAPRIDPRQRLPLPLVAECGRLRTDNLANDFAQQMKLATDRLLRSRHIPTPPDAADPPAEDGRRLWGEVV